LPISEVLILVGAIVTVIGERRGLSHSNPTLFAGLVAAGIGVGEFTWREHKGGFRSHTWMLTTLSLMVLDIVLILAVSAVTQAPKALVIVVPLLDVALGIVLFKLLRARFIDAHRARVFEGKRSRR
jgi:hypothetical protein